MKRALLVLAACGPQVTTTAHPPPAPSSTIDTGIIESQLLEGTVTLVDFWAEYCGACITVAGHVAVAIAREQRIRVIKVDVGDGTTEVARRYRVGTLPHWKVYDTHKRLRYVLLGSEVLRAPQLAQELLSER